MKTIIHVTDRHIDRGIGCDAVGCAIAIAAEEALPQYNVWCVGTDRIFLEHLLSGRDDTTKLSANANDFRLAFDLWAKQKDIPWPRPEPISFEIEIPDQNTHHNSDCAPSMASNNAPEPELVSQSSGQPIKSRISSYV